METDSLYHVNDDSLSRDFSDILGQGKTGYCEQESDNNLDGKEDFIIRKQMRFF